MYVGGYTSSYCYSIDESIVERIPNPLPCRMANAGICDYKKKKKKKRIPKSRMYQGSG